MKSVLLILVATLAVAAGGYGLCALAGWRLHAGCVAFAGADVFVASIVALVPLFLARGATQQAVAQASLVGSVIHLFGSLVGAAVLLLVLRAGPAMLYWLLAFYWATLAALAVAFSHAVRAAPPATAGPKR